MAGTQALERAFLGEKQFVAMISMIMALGALGIDLMLPAFPVIREHFGLAEGSTAVAGIVTAYFFGLAFGQLFYGPIADRFGRKPALYGGLAIYAFGALSSALVPSIGLMYVTRFIWGAGAAGGRVIAIAVVRDSFSGERMARTMSMVMAVFVLVPVVAPTVGAAVIAVAPWQWVFGVCVLFSLTLAVWIVRLPETLREEHRRPLQFTPVLRGARQVLTHRQTLGYGLVTTALFAPFSSYLASSEIIFSDVFGLEDQFPFIFGGIAAVMGAAMVASAMVVERVGTKRLAHAALTAYVVLGAGVLWMVRAADGVPGFWPFVVGLTALLVCHALLIPSANTLAMDHMGKLAGTAAAVLGTISMAGGAVLGSITDRAFDGTANPLILSFFGYGVVALALAKWAEGAKTAPVEGPRDAAALLQELPPA